MSLPGCFAVFSILAESAHDSISFAYIIDQILQSIFDVVMLDTDRMGIAYDDIQCSQRHFFVRFDRFSRQRLSLAQSLPKPTFTDSSSRRSSGLFIAGCGPPENLYFDGIASKKPSFPSFLHIA